MFSFRLSVLAVGLALATGVGCADVTGVRTGRISVLLTDAPGDVTAAVVTISEIYLQGGQDEGGGRVTLMNSPFTVDLLTLVDATATLVEEMEIPAGRYAQLRFVVTGGYLEVETEDGGSAIYASSPTYDGLPPEAVVTGALQMPSYASSGIKVNVPGGITIGPGEKILLVDFDVSQSFGHAAGTDAWVMHPVLEATNVAVGAAAESTP